jgi:hypothetical protein
MEKAHLGKNYREETANKMGQKYWLNFCERHAREIESKKAVRYDSKRDDLCTLENFERMHDNVYDTMVKAGVTRVLDEWIYQDRQGNIVLEDDPERYGQKTKHVLTHPERVLLLMRLVQTQAKIKMDTLEEESW